MRSARAVWTSTVVWAALLVSCGGTVFTSSGGGGDGGSDSGDGSASPLCPAAPPSAGSTCSPVGLECEYGTDPDPNCNSRWQCQASGWLDRTPGPVCPPPGTQCPLTYAQVPVHQMCNPNLLTCPYPEGVCLCTDNGFGGIMQNPAWACYPTKAGCPSPRPHLGDPCTQPGLDCNYGACAGGIEMLCKDGYWQEEQTACPV